MAGIPRYLVEKGPDQIKTAFRGVLDLCNEHDISRVTLVVPKKGGWEHTLVAEFLGSGMTKALLNGQAVPLVKGGATITLESPQTFRNNVGQGLILGAHISGADMAKIDDAWDAKAILYMPWTEAEGQAWQATWLPQTVGPSTSTPPVATLSAPVVEALERLTRNINLGSGLGHPSDKALAVRAIADLHAEGRSFDPTEIKRWALRHHWSSHAAADLEAIAKKAARR